MYMYSKCSFNYLKVFKLLEFEKCIGKENRSQFYSQIDCLSTCKYKVLQTVILFRILGSYLFLHIWENILLELGKLELKYMKLGK